MTGADRPMLSFWQQYAFEQNQDFGSVEVSTDNGGSWARLYVVTGASGAVWSQAKVPLDGYEGTELVVRFRLRSDGQNAAEGWYIDDVRVSEVPSLALGYTFYDSVDSDTARSRWLPSSWQQVTGSATTASGKSWRLLLGNQYQPGGDSFFPLTLGGTIDLGQAVSPKLWFSWRAGSTPQWDWLQAQVSTDGGRTWAGVWSWNPDWWNSAGWNQVQVDLASYVGNTNVSLRFLAYQRSDRPFQADYQIDEVLFAEGNGMPAILTDSPFPAGIGGSSYSLTLQATHGATPYNWAVVSNTLPPGLTLDGTHGIISGIPTNLGTYNFWLSVTASNNLSSQRPFSLTIRDYVPVFPTHAVAAFVSPGTNVIYGQLDNQTAHHLLSLVWKPALPPGWGVVSAVGDGAPAVGPDGSILFQAQYLTNSPLQFSYAISVPAGVTTAQPIGGTAVFLLDDGMGNERALPALPDPVFSLPRTFHSEDCDTNWVIDSVEAGRVLAYWRAQAYHLDPSTCDGYAPGVGFQQGSLCSADYRAPFWSIDGTEVNRVLAYWRAGFYRADTNGPEGFSASAGPPATQPLVRFQQQAPPQYQAGATLLVTNVVTYTNTALSLLVRPVLPAGWTITNLLADGAPEKVNGEIVWTGAALPDNRVQVVYVVNVPSGEAGAKQIRNEVEYQMAGMANPANLSADAATLQPIQTVPPSMQFASIHRLANGSVQLSMTGNVVGSVTVQWTSALQGGAWTTLTSLPSLNTTVLYTDTTAAGQPARFYRLATP